MSVTGLVSVVLAVPDIAPGVGFYEDAGLEASIEGAVARLRCAGQDADSIVLLGGADRKRLHHLTMRVRDIDTMPESIRAAGGTILPPPDGLGEDGLWAADPHGMVYHLVEGVDETPLQAIGDPFSINAPGRIARVRRPAILPRSAYPAARPLRLGHALCFTPDVGASVGFVTEGLGMGLADRAQDAIAFCCARTNSDHHVLAFAKSPGIGFHHASFQLAGPDEVGRAGRALADTAGRGDWGFGRHTIGSNFFHYVQDPWGSWFEYYADMDHIDDHALWTPTDYAMEDSLASWGPVVPEDFVRNYEVG